MTRGIVSRRVVLRQLDWAERIQVRTPPSKFSDARQRADLAPATLQVDHVEAGVLFDAESFRPAGSTDCKDYSSCRPLQRL